MGVGSSHWVAENWENWRMTGFRWFLEKNDWFQYENDRTLWLGIGSLTSISSKRKRCNWGILSVPGLQNSWHHGGVRTCPYSNITIISPLNHHYIMVQPVYHLLITIVSPTAGISDVCPQICEAWLKPFKKDLSVSLDTVVILAEDIAEGNFVDD